VQNTDGGLGLVLRWCAGRAQNVNLTTLSKRPGTYKGTMTTGACELLYLIQSHMALSAPAAGLVCFEPPTHLQQRVEI
jgi:hypothetical protein